MALTGAELIRMSALDGAGKPAAFDQFQPASAIAALASAGTAVVAITAGTARTQGGATVLVRGLNRVDTSTAPAAGTVLGDGVALPAAASGALMVVINNTANPIQVYGNGADTINGVAGSVGVSLPPGSADVFWSLAAGSWNFEAGVGASGIYPLMLTANGVVAAGANQAGAAALPGDFNSVNSGAGGVRLPASVAGMDIVVVNISGANLNIYPAGADQINASGASLPIVMPNNAVDTFICPVGGNWYVEAGVGFSGSLNTVLAQDAITAAGTTQAGATLLTTDFNRLTTVAAASGVKLPVSAPGLDIFIVNHGANAVQVYGSGADLIDDVATAIGVTQMSFSVVLYTCTSAGNWYSEGLATGFGGPGLQTLSFSPALTAFAGGGQASATPMPNMINRVSVVANAGDSVKLPTAVAGLAITVLNRGANPMQCFGNGTDTINGIATATGISHGIQTQALYICNIAGNWEVTINSLQSSVPAALSVNGAIPPHTGHTYVITKAGVLADTLAAPTAGADDGIEITFTSNTANAHTITATGLLQTGSAAANVATFAAFAGAGLTLMAYQGKWNVISAVGITFS